MIEPQDLNPIQMFFDEVLLFVHIVIESNRYATSIKNHKEGFCCNFLAGARPPKTLGEEQGHSWSFIVVF